MSKNLNVFLALAFSFIATAVFAQPANNNCTGAVALTIFSDESSAVPVVGTTVGATGSTSPTSVCSGSWFGDDVWYSFTTGAVVPANGITIKVGTAMSGAMSPLGMAVYAGCGAGETPLQCFSSCNPADPSMTFFGTALTANTTYYIRMWSGCSPTANSGAFDIIVFEREGDNDIVIWGNNPGEGDFDGGLNGWTSNSLTSSGGVADNWVYEADASANGAFRNSTIASPTAFNGAALFDADFMSTQGDPNNAPPQPYPVHQAELISPIIDCSNCPAVSVKFYQSYDALNGDTWFQYSLDGGQTWIPPTSAQGFGTNVNGDVTANASTPSISVKKFFLQGASGSSQLRLKFTADMDFYNWIIDDVQLVQTENNNLKINPFYAIAPAYSMPRSQVDTLRFVADITNRGAAPQTNVNLNVSIFKNSDNSQVFSADLPYGTLNPGDTVENQLFPQVFIPDTAIESYTATYTLSSDSTDADPTDNSVSFTFEVVDTVYAKEPNFTGGITPSADNNYTYGTSYFIREGGPGRHATAISFGATNPADLAGESVTLFLEIGQDLDGNGTITNITEKTVAAFGSYTFTGTEPADQLITVPISDFTTGGLHELQPNTTYLAVVNFIASTNNPNAQFFMMVNRDLDYSAADFATILANTVPRYTEIIDVGNSGNYGTGGFVGAPTPAVRLHITEPATTSTNNITKLEENVLNVFPNPADEFITADINFEGTEKNVTVAIMSITGQIMTTRNFNQMNSEKVMFDLNNFPSGTYIMSVATDSGYVMKRFIVAK